MIPLLSRPSINNNVLVSPSSSPHERMKYDRLKISVAGSERPQSFKKATVRK